MAHLTALLDANVLYPAGLRDFLLRLADQYLYAPLWSADIHAEWIGSVLADRPDLTADVLQRTRTVMDRHFPDARNGPRELDSGVSEIFLGFQAAKSR